MVQKITRLTAQCALSFTLLLLTACTVPGTYFSQGSVLHRVVPLTASPQSTQPYKVGPYDILNIIVWDHPELTTPATQNANPRESGILVNADGDIYFPFVGKLHVAELTMDEIRQVLQKKLSHYLKSPQALVRVADFRSKTVNVIGEIKNPGIKAITDKPLTLLDALNQSGGINAMTADLRHIYVIRQDTPHTIYWLNAKTPRALFFANRFTLKNKDVVYVSTAPVSSWNRLLGHVIPTLQTGATYARITHQTRRKERVICKLHYRMTLS